MTFACRAFIMEEGRLDDMKFQEANSLEERLQLARKLAERFHERAEAIDREGAFPYENIQELRDTGYTSLTMPRAYGGQEISLYEMVRLQEMLATGDGSTALAIGWHVGTMKSLAEKNSWSEPVFRRLCEDVLHRGALINGAATEPATGSPTRGGKFQTTAVWSDGQWVVNGRKTFTTLAPVLDYFLVNVTVPERDRAASILVPRSSDGVRIEETWDSVAMRGTGSHDLVLENVRVDASYLVEWLDAGSKRASGWLLHIPACYLGIAQAAQSYAIRFARQYAPNSLSGGTIIDLPNVQSKIGEMELELMRSREFLYAIAKRWDESDEEGRNALKPELGAVKMTVTNAALKVVDLAMRLVGAHSLSLKNPLQRYYRDARAGLHNPPMDDMTIQLLARTAVMRESNDSSE